MSALLPAAKLAAMAPGLAYAGKRGRRERACLVGAGRRARDRRPSSSLLSGTAAQRAGMPQVTGYALAGAALGPACARLLSRSDLASLARLDAAALAAIALAAGAELRVRELRKTGRQVICVTLGVAAASAAAVAAALAAFPAAARSLTGGDTGAIPAAIALAGVLAAARSPAAAVAVLRETGGAGPFCSLVMAVVVAKDVLVFAAFALVCEAAAAAARHGGASLAAAARPAAALAVSAAVGVVGGGALATALAAWPPNERQHGAARLRAAVPRAADGGVRAVAAAVAAAATAAAAAALGGEPLLACVAAGAMAANWKGANSTAAADAPSATPPRPPPAPAHAARTRLDAALASLAPAVNLAFFSLAGASLRLGALPRTAPAAALIVAARAAGVAAGAAAGAAAGGVPPSSRPHLWRAMVTQAGVALGLARAVEARFPAWGGDFAATHATVIIINLAMGPPLFRSAVLAVGEGTARASLSPARAASSSPARPPRSPRADANGGGLASPGATRPATSGGRSGGDGGV